MLEPLLCVRPAPSVRLHVPDADGHCSGHVCAESRPAEQCGQPGYLLPLLDQPLQEPQARAVSRLLVAF